VSQTYIKRTGLNSCPMEYRAADLTPEGFHQGFQKKKSEADLCASGAFNLAAGKGFAKINKTVWNRK